MAFSLQKILTSKYLFVAASVVVVAASTFLNTLQNYDSYKASGYSMLPNYWPEQIITGHKNFKDITRHEVYMTTEDRYQRIVGGTVTNSVSTKRVIGMPGDKLTFDRASGSLTHINQQVVTYSVATGMVALKTVDSDNGSTWYTRAYKYIDHLGGSFFVYQIQPEQIDSANKLARQSMSKYTQFNYLNQVAKEGDSSVTVQLGSDEYFLLSDNRTDGVDSRYYGPVHRSEFLFEVDTESTPQLAVAKNAQSTK